MQFRRTIPLIAAFAILAGGSVAAIFPPALVSTGTQATLTRATAAPEPTPSILDVTNDQKKALTGITAGQEVRISDAFVVSGGGEVAANGFLPQTDTQLKEFYGDAGGTHVSWDGVKWNVFDNDNGRIYSSTEEDVAFPWQVVTWTSVDPSFDPVPTLTHPALQSFLGGDPSDEASWSTIDDVADATARFSLLGIPVGKRVNQLATEGIYPAGVYQYNGPSTDDVAGMVANGTDVYTVRGVSNGKNYYNKIGFPDDATSDGIAWADAHGSSFWTIFGTGGGTTDQSDGNDVPTPDLASGWATQTVTIDHIAAPENWSVVAP
ncbi:MAG: hypothetical protein QOE26_2768 [Verrucomicrobiota bacterium]|jgi:hypothetical protein